jgi:hypothetical protein
MPDGGQQRIVLLEKLQSQVEVDGQQASIFLATIDGLPGTIVRIGSSLDIAFDDDQDPPAPGAGVIDHGEVPLPTSLARRAENQNLDPDTAMSEELHVWLFLHDASNESNHAKFLNRYVDWWVKDMEKTVKPGVPVRVSLRTNVPGITDMNYHQGDHGARIRDVAWRGQAYAQSQGTLTGPLTKYVLVVDEPAANWDKDMRGGAIERFGAAIASTQAHHHIVAHEIGHLLGATHEEAERRILYGCITNMKDSIWGWTPCRYYSKANDENIRQYVRARSGR